MHHNINKLGIIAGSGNLPKQLIKFCKEKNINFYLVAIKNNYSVETDNIIPDISLSIRCLGDFFRLFKNHGVSHVVLIGGIKKPSLVKIFPNLITLKYILKLFFVYRKGDNKLLSKIIKIIEFEGFKVLGANVFLSSSIAPYGLLTKKVNIDLNKFNYKELISYAKNFGKLDKGQSLLISNNTIVAQENSEGTDYMLLNIKKLNFKELILVKASKPNQDVRVDLPTIGEETIINAKKAGIIGIVIEANKTFIADYQNTISLANANNIFIFSENG